MRQARGLQYFARGDETCGIETELRVLASARGPFARAFAVKADANADVRFHADFICRADLLLDLFELFVNDVHLLVVLSSKHLDADERRLLITVANDDAFRILMHCQR